MDALDVQGSTCLHAAALAGHQRCVALILDSGGDAMLEEKDVGVRQTLHCLVGRLAVSSMSHAAVSSPRGGSSTINKPSILVSLVARSDPLFCM
jgi:hypothetical protein